jgi:hypothetical protein
MALLNPEIICMALNKILVPMSDSAENAVALNLAAEIATYFHAHIEVATAGLARPDSGPSYTTLRSGDITPDIDQGVFSRFEAWRHRCRLELQPECAYRGLASTSLVVHKDTPESGVANRARFADLVCFAAEPGEAEIQRTMVLHLLFSSGRPILFRPVREDTRDAAIMGEPIVIGWNGSVEAVRAVTGALPFIQTSRLVEVISIGEKSVNAFDAYELAKYLSWSGVRAAATGLAVEDWTGRDVVDAALARDAKLLVMGARVSGNATNHMFQTLPMTVLMAA